MKTPVLKRHARGQWYTRYWHLGREHSKYFGRDKPAAQAAFNAWLPEWMSLKVSTPKTTRRGQILIIQLSEKWLSHIQLTKGPTLMKQYRSYTQNFVNISGEVPAAHITVEHLEAHAADLKSLAYSTVSIRSYLKGVKMMLTWAARRKLMPRPDFADFRLPKLPRPRPRAFPPRAIADHIHRAAQQPPAHPQLEHWLSLIYLTCARPSEIHRMINCYAINRGSSVPNSFGTFITLDGENAPVIFETRSKTQDVDGYARWIPLSREALRHLALSRPQWSLQRFLKLALDATTYDPPPPSCVRRGAKALRSLGASQLRSLGASREDVKQILGHATAEPIDHYAAESLEHLRALVSRLALPRGAAKAEDDEWVPPT